MTGMKEENTFIRTELLSLRWKAGELLPGHVFRIHDLAVLKNSGRIVLLTDVLHGASRYGFIDLAELEPGDAPLEDFRPAKGNEITPEHEVLRGKLIRILRFQGEGHWKRLLSQVLKVWEQT